MVRLDAGDQASLEMQVKAVQGEPAIGSPFFHDKETIMQDTKQEAVVILEGEPGPSYLAQLKTEYLAAVIAENGHLRVAVAAEREALIHAYGHLLDPIPPKQNRRSA